MSKLSLKSTQDVVSLEPGRFTKLKRQIIREKYIWILCAPMIIWVLIFSYYPMYGMLMAFFDYVPGKSLLDCTFVGFKYFKEFFNSPDFLVIMRNTLSISFLNLLIGFPIPIIFAVLLNELRGNRFKKLVQTISYLPYFISWVVAASLIFQLLGSDGLITIVLRHLGFLSENTSLMSEGKYFWGILTSANIWKGMGWSSIIYLSAISGIDAQLYDAAAVDGVNRWGRIWHIILPGIRGTIILLLILNIGGILNAGFEQQLLLGAPQNREYWDVIDTYVYRYGVQLGRYSYATAVGVFKSVIGVTLVFSANKLSKKFFDMTVI
jgi:putative aldouronate transport system permease protein